MMKIVFAAAVVVVVAVAGVMAMPVLEKPPVLRTSLKNYRAVQVQRCDNIACSSGCKTLVEYPLYQCHNSFRAFDHGEIFRPAGFSAKRTCFREHMFESKNNEGCKGKEIQSAPRELGQCMQDVFPPGKFSVFRGNDTAVTMFRDCDYNCLNCGLEVPVSYDQCMQPRFHPKFGEIAFSNSKPFSCGGEGWSEIIMDAFLLPTCDARPDYQTSAFEDMCYVYFGHGHKFVLV